MPLMKCQVNAKSGWKWGSEGHCYLGPGGKEKAKKQGRAIERSKHLKGEKSEESGKDLAELYLEEDPTSL